jgi:hypothetical protein
MEPKRLGLLRELAPGVPLIGVLLNLKFASASRQLRQIEEAARSVDQPIVVANAWLGPISGSHQGPAARTAAFKGQIHGCTRTLRGTSDSSCTAGAVHTWHATFCCAASIRSVLEQDRTFDDRRGRIETARLTPEQT